MKIRKAVALVVALVLVGAGCQGRREGPARPAKDEIVVGTPADGFRTDGDRANLGMFPVNANIFETLVRMTPDFRVEPWLAERWEFLGENTWRFHLRRGVTFHDGKPLTAAAVKSTFDRVARLGGGSLRLGPDSLKVVDEATVDITPRAPNLRLVDQLVHPNLGIISPDTEVGTGPVGTGPFRFAEYVKDQRLVVERHDGYWGKKALLEKITFRPIPDDNARWLSLKSGDIDMMYDLPRELLAEARKTGGVKLGITPPGASEILLLNRNGAEPYTILQDRAVRLAIGHAIDRRALVEEIWTGSARVESTMTPAALFGKDASLIKGPAYDPGKARSLLDEAGWKAGDGGVRLKEGRKLSLTMVNGYPPIALRKPMPELVQAQLKEVGIETAIVETPELGTYLTRLGNGDGDIFLERVAQNDANPSFFASNFFYSKATGDYAKWFPAGPEFDAAVEGALGSADRAQATRKAAEAMHVAIDQEAVVLPAAAVFWIFAMNDAVRGFVLHGSARHVRWAGVSFGG